MPNETSLQPKEEVTISLSDLFGVLKKNLAWILIATVLCGALGFVFTMLQKPTYSTNSMYMVYSHDTTVTNPGEDEPPISSMTSNHISMSRAYKEMYVQELTESQTLPRVLRLWLIAKYGYTSETVPTEKEIKEAIKITTDDSEYFLFRVSVASEDENLALHLNLAFGEIVSDLYKNDKAYPVLKAAAAGIAPIQNEDLSSFQTQLSGIGISFTADADYTAFSGKLAELLSRTDMAPTAAQDIDYIAAFVAGSKIYFRDASIAPKLTAVSSVYIIVALFAGFLLSYVFFFVLKLLDTKIRTEEDLKNATPFPLLASIPAIEDDFAR